jgi:hypothetical protein
MARFYPISPLFWNDSKVKEWDEPTRNLALYLLTCEHRNLEGLYRLPYAYISADLDWPVEDVRERMATLIFSGFIHYDEAARVVFLPKALKYHSVTSENHVKGAINDLQAVPDTTLYELFLGAAEEFAPTLFKALSNGSETLAEGLASA